MKDISLNLKLIKSLALATDVVDTVMNKNEDLHYHIGGNIFQLYEGLLNNKCPYPPPSPPFFLFSLYIYLTLLESILLTDNIKKDYADWYKHVQVYI